MKKTYKKLKKVLFIIFIITIIIAGGGYLGLNYLRATLEAKITGCELVTKDFQTVLNFEYVNNWILVYAKIGDSDKEYPFLFDTGAPTTVLDSLLKEIGSNNFETTFKTKGDSVEHAFKSELINLKSIELGGVRFKNIGTFSASNSKWGMLNCISPYGIIGYNIIQDCCFQIDYEKKQIILTDRVENLANYDEIEWIKYEPLKTQESPVMKAVINDTIQVDLLFDTGMNGSISLSSDKYFQTFSNQFSKQIIALKTKPSIIVRGVENEPTESLKYKMNSFVVGNNKHENINIVVKNSQEREFQGSLGNGYFENFIITLDYKNRRIGFIPKKSIAQTDSTYGLGYLPYGDRVLVSMVYNGLKPDLSGIKPGDEIYSINGIRIDDLDSDTFCKIYRGEYSFQNTEDSVLYIGILNNESIIEYEFKKQKLFNPLN